MAGRFKKGETPKGAIPISEGIAKEMQARSVQARYAKKRGKARRERKTLADRYDMLLARVYAPYMQRIKLGIK